MRCTKAIIPIAGYGTRRLPITKAIEKCMLPVGNRPVIDYIVEDCIRAGITEFLFVVGEEFDQIRRYYGQNQLLEDYLESKGKTKELEEVRGLNRKARFHYVIQDQYQPYGTTTPVWLCRHLIKPDEKVLMMYGDAFLYRPDGGSDLTDFLQQAEQNGAQSAMLAQTVDWEEVSHYGILSIDEQNGQEYCTSILEQPKRQDAPTNIANVGCYYFDYSIFKFADQNLEQHFEGEHRLTDAINDYISTGNTMRVFRSKGEFLDCGNTDAWLRTNLRIIGKPASKKL
jgi:UTP--glucose-1-phosphate uridylyltransferase